MVCHFPIIPLLKFYGTKFGSLNIIMLYPNLCCKEVCYTGTALGLEWALQLLFFVSKTAF